MPPKEARMPFLPSKPIALHRAPARVAIERAGPDEAHSSPGRG